MDSRFSAAGRHALVTGGGRGIGRAVAAALTHAGARVTVLGRDEARLAETVASGDAVASQRVDMTDTAALRAALATAGRETGRVEILVNNAGDAVSAPFGGIARAAWDWALALNLTAVFEATQAVLPGMVAAGAGRIVTIASTAGLVGYPYAAAYCAAKHGAVGLTRALAREFARFGITINAVCPGYTDTDLVARSAEAVAARTGQTADAIRARYAGNNPQGRLVEPAEVAAAVLWLCGPGSDAITGQAIAVAGGEV